jgi:DNA-binding GntR family transcriptional regulator
VSGRGLAGDGYLRLRDAITTGEFAPNQRLVEAELVEMLGVGRAAVRSALTRLEQEGLVVREPHRGARVRKVHIAEAVEITEARAALEAAAARHAARRATPDDIAELQRIHEQMRACLASGDPLGYSDGNARMHAKILQISGHRTIQRLVAGLKAQVVRFQYRTVLVPGRQVTSLEEHGRIVAAIAAGDPDAAEAAMRDHIGRVAETLGQTAAAQDQTPIVTEALPTGTPPA